jgi:hypothetical protein
MVPAKFTFVCRQAYTATTQRLPVWPERVGLWSPRQSAAKGRFGRSRTVEFQAMPSLIRLLMVVGLLGGAAYGAMFALANFVQPKQREMTITIPQQKLKPN